MKKANYALALIGLVIAVLTFFTLKNTLFAVEIGVIALLFALGTKLSSASDEVFTLLILNGWITLFNVLGILSHYSNALNVYEIDLRVVVQYMIPLLVALVLKTYYTKAKSMPRHQIETAQEVE